MTTKPPKPKKCRVCSDAFQPMTRTQIVCGWQCAIKHAENVSAKKEARELREAKTKLKSRRDWMREAQAVFNRFIRLRDAGQPCISCGRHHQGQIHAGHYLSVGSHHELRFDGINVHAQCAPCNNHLSGNIVMYRKGLIERYGQHVVDYLEGPHNPKKYTVDDLKQIKAHYTSLCKEIESKKY